MIDSLGSPPLIFGVDIPCLRPSSDANTDFICADLLSLFADPKASALRLSLADFREAIRNPKDTAFFCFRAIESLRHFFTHHKQAKDKKQSWEYLREELNITESEIKVVQVLADPIRHGDSYYISDMQRADVYITIGASCQRLKLAIESFTFPFHCTRML